METKCVPDQTSDCVNKSPDEGYYSCTCKDGFEGDFCQENVDECEGDPCQNDATCVDGVNDYTCECSGQFAGKNCTVSNLIFLWIGPLLFTKLQWNKVLAIIIFEKRIPKFLNQWCEVLTKTSNQNMFLETIKT